MKEHAKRSMVLVAGYAPADRQQIEAAITQAQWSQAVCFVDGKAELIELLNQAVIEPAQRSVPSPSLILLNTDGLGVDGQQALIELKSHPAIRCIPVVVLSMSKEKDEVLESYMHGISGYISLPKTSAEWVEVMAVVKKYWFDTVILPSARRG